MCHKKWNTYFNVRNIAQPTKNLSDRLDQYSGIMRNDLNSSWKTFNNES